MRMVICKDAELIPFGEMRAPEVLVAAEALVPAALLRAALRAAGPPLVTEPRPHRTPVGMAMIRNGRASPLVRGNAVPTGRHAERGTMRESADCIAFFKRGNATSVIGVIVIVVPRSHPKRTTDDQGTDCDHDFQHGLRSQTKPTPPITIPSRHAAKAGRAGQARSSGGVALLLHLELAA